MAVPSFNISGYLTEISDCDAGTNWNVTDVDTDIKVEGIAAGVDAIRSGGTLTYTFPSSVDMSTTNTHIRQWLVHNFPSYLKTKALGGIQLFIGDGTYTAFWYVGGSDNHNGAWQLFQADLSATPDLGALPTLTAITKFGFVLDHATSARNLNNTYWDMCTFAIGYEIYGGTSGDKVTWHTTATADTGSTSALQYGIIELIKGGAFYLNSGLWIGDSAGTGDCYFDGTNQTIIFYDSDEKLGLYKIIGTGNSTGTTDIDLSGSVIKSAGTAFVLDMSDANVDSFKMDGAKVENASASTFKLGQSVQGAVFTDCGTISTNGSTFEKCTVNLSGLITVSTTGTFKDNIIDKATGTVATSLPSLTGRTGNSWISDGTGHAVNLGTISSDQSMTWDNTDSGYASVDGSTGNETILVSVDSGITLTINVASTGTVPTIYNTGLGTVSVVTGQITVQVTVYDDSTGLPLQYARVRLNKDSDQSNILSAETNASGIVSTTISYTADIPVHGWARQWDLTGDDYIAKNISGTITSGGLSIDVRLTPI